MNLRRKYWPVMVGASAMAVIAGLTYFSSRETPPPPGPPAALPETSQPPLERAEPFVEKKQPAKKPSLVLVWIESTPPGARMVRVSDNFILGRTPETIGLSWSSTPVPVRFELEGFHPEIHEISAVSDGSLSVVLRPVP